MTRTEPAPLCLLAAVLLVAVGVPYVGRALVVCGLIVAVVWTCACLVAVATDGDEGAGRGR